MLNFNVRKDEAVLISRIADRALHQIEGYPDDKMTLVMDLTACHASGMRLRLQELLDAEPTDFAHDVTGIRYHINRRTGHIEDHFVPRYHDSGVRA